VAYVIIIIINVLIKVSQYTVWHSVASDQKLVSHSQETIQSQLGNSAKV